MLIRNGVSLKLLLVGVKMQFNHLELGERAAPKVKFKAIDVRVLYAREMFSLFVVVAKLLKGMVARDGIEPPTPAFSGPLTEFSKWFAINGCH